MASGTDPAASLSGRAWLLRTLALLPVCFLGWHLLAPLIASPSLWLAQVSLPHIFSELIESVVVRGPQLVILSRLGELDGALIAAEQAGNQLQFTIDARTLSYSIPFFATLLLASPVDEKPARLTTGLFVLWAFIGLGLIFTTGKDLMLNLPEPFLATSPLPSDLVALGYQLSVLIIPPLAPVLLWCWSIRGLAQVQSLFRTEADAGASQAEASSGESVDSP